MERHEEYHGLRGYIWRRSRCNTLASRSGTDQHLIGHASMGRRDAGKERRRESARDSREHHWCESILLKIGILFGAAAVEIWVSLLEPQDRMAFLQGFKAKSEKLRLRSVGVAGKLPGYVDGSTAGNEV